MVASESEWATKESRFVPAENPPPHAIPQDPHVKAFFKRLPWVEFPEVLIFSAVLVGIRGFARGH
jgi:hypothetical protein